VARLFSFIFPILWHQANGRAEIRAARFDAAALPVRARDFG